MPPKSIQTLVCLLGLLIGLLACKKDPSPQSETCRLTSTSDQLLESNGTLTDLVSRTFAYTNGTLTEITEQSTTVQGRFLLERSNSRVERVSRDTNDELVLTYAATATQPLSATFSRNGVSYSTFDMTYTGAGMMASITERRQVLPNNSLTLERSYTFTYDQAGNLITERNRSTLVGGATPEQETDYTTGPNASPYHYLPERAVLTLIAMTLGADSAPGRFWHLKTPAEYKLYSLTNGVRGSLRESATNAPTYDNAGKLLVQEQTSLLYQASNPNPITRKNRQAYTYACE
ncbi:hypothetical protein [Spirosoma sp. 209]|uniref:hypothetical protein n=1 Tax=Spirosoma sp. 209 TaxID=1955701 RepID=UPI0011179EF5|nr:hypothetical protein [Spirosoma sp. 209]